jgi:hypothetical protein
MASKLLLCASSFHLSVGLWTGRRLASVRTFEDDESGQRAFHAFVQGVAGVPAYLMADTVDEDYRFETLPHATGSDRREMVERKLRQLYRSTPYFGTSRQEREGDKRRDDRYLFAALTNGEVFNPWLQILIAAKTPIAGAFPLPMVTMALVKRLDLADASLLVVSKHSAGVRQTFIKDQRFRISRLTPVRHADQRAQDDYAEEIRNTRMYLDALNVTHVEDMVTVVVLDQDGSLATLGQRVVAGRRNLRTVHLGPEDLCAKTGIEHASLQHGEDALHLHLLGLQTPDFNLAPPALTAGFSRYRASRVIYAASAATALVGALWCGKNLYQSLDLRQSRQSVLAEVQRQQHEYQGITRTFPPTPTSTERLKHTVEVARRIHAMTRLPDQAYRVISQALDANPAITLSSLTWRNGRIGQTESGAGSTLAQSALLQVELQAMPSDYRGAIATVSKFVKDLGSHQAVASARTAKLPVNLSSTATLSGSTADPRKEQPITAQFDVEIVLKPEA